MYKINNIALDDFGIIPGRVSGEGIAIKGMFDLPKRIGDTYKDWDDSQSVEPYVDADELFFAGRTILFAGIILGTKTEVENKLTIFKTAITSFTDVVRFETPYGTACVWIKKLTPKLYSEGATFILELREPVVGATCPILFESTIYYSAEYSESTFKNDCAAGYDGSSVQLTAVAGKFTSTYSQAAADQLAIDWVKENKQVYANTQGTCILQPPIYYNVKLVGELKKDNCAVGFEGSIVTYEVPAFKYSSTVSQLAVDTMAQAELDATLTQAYANDNGYCTELPAFFLVKEELWFWLWAPAGIYQWFEVGEKITIGQNYHLMLFGLQFSHTTVATDTPQSIINDFVTIINATSFEDWDLMNQRPSTLDGWKTVASLEGNTLKLQIPGASQGGGATTWIDNS